MSIGDYINDEINLAINGTKEIKSVILVNGTIEVVSVIDTGTRTLGIPSKRIVKVYKEIFGVVDGEIKLINRIEGRYVPSQVISESYDFDD